MRSILPGVIESVFRDRCPLSVIFPQAPLNRGFHPSCGKESPSAFFPVTPLGKNLYRHRGVIGGIFFLVLLPFSCGQFSIIGFFLLIIGMALRFWARGYIGRESDSRVFSLPEVITSSIYWLRHPLYLANFFLVLGVLLFLNPPKVMAYACLSGFGLEYGLFVLCEERLRKNGKQVKRRWSFSHAVLEVRTALILCLIFCSLALRRFVGLWSGF